MPKIDLDYSNFVARMGSFDDNFDDLLSDGGINSGMLLTKEKSLSHHGILGQKWGVRRSEAQLGNSSSKKSSGLRRLSEEQRDA